jgi:hypothetical protein
MGYLTRAKKKESEDSWNVEYLIHLFGDLRTTKEDQEVPYGPF